MWYGVYKQAAIFTQEGYSQTLFLHPLSRQPGHHSLSKRGRSAAYT